MGRILKNTVMAAALAVATGLSLSAPTVAHAATDPQADLMVGGWASVWEDGLEYEISMGNHGPATLDEAVVGIRFSVKAARGDAWQPLRWKSSPKLSDGCRTVLPGSVECQLSELASRQEVMLTGDFTLLRKYSSERLIKIEIQVRDASPADPSPLNNTVEEDFDANGDARFFCPKDGC